MQVGAADSARVDLEHDVAALGHRVGDVRDVEMHVWRAEALLAQALPADAAREYDMAVTLAPDRNDLRLALAQAYLAAAQPAQAKAAVKALLERDPDNNEVKELLEKLP